MEAYYKKQHSGRKLCWMHHWSSGTMVFGTANGGRFDLEITTFQMAVLFCFNERAHEKISLETLRLATELPDAELNRTLIVSECFTTCSTSYFSVSGRLPEDAFSNSSLRRAEQ